MQIAFMLIWTENMKSIDGSNQKRLTNNDFDDWYPSWSPDGSQLIFHQQLRIEKEIGI